MVFCVCFLSYDIIFGDSAILWYVSVLHFFLLANSIALYGYANFFCSPVDGRLSYVHSKYVSTLRVMRQ